MVVENHVEDRAGRVSLLSCDGELIWTRPRRMIWNDCHAARWAKSESSLLFCDGPFPGLIDGYGEVAAISCELYAFGSAAHGYCADGHDAVLTWTPEGLNIYVPNP